MTTTDAVPSRKDTGARFFWRHLDGKSEFATPAMMARLHGLDAAHAYRMTNPAKYPSCRSHRGWRIADAPNPGSVEAQQFSCTCPVIDNHYGAGRPGGKGTVFIYTEGCPLHWPKEAE